MFKIRRAEPSDVDGAIAVLGDAFAQDPLMLYLFRDNPDGVRAGAMTFFSMLLRARIALGMPACVLHQADGPVGAMMGYDTSRPAWPASLALQWRVFESTVPGLAPRLAAYEKICEAHQPGEDHYYLGVIGVHPSAQGKGAGKAMLDSFCEESRADPRARGVYLDTSSPRSLEFYYKSGFELRGAGRLDEARLWCVYKRT